MFSRLNFILNGFIIYLIWSVGNGIWEVNGGWGYSVELDIAEDIISYTVLSIKTKMCVYYYAVLNLTSCDYQGAKLPFF